MRLQRDSNSWHDLLNPGAMLDQLSYCMKPCWKQVWCDYNLYGIIWREWQDVYSIYIYIYDKDHLSALQIKNTSERDPHGCEVHVELEQLQRKLRKNCDSPMGFKPMTSAMVTSVSQVTKTELAKIRLESWRLSCRSCCKYHFHFYSLSAVHSYYDLYHIYIHTSCHSLHISSILYSSNKICIFLLKHRQQTQWQLLC